MMDKRKGAGLVASRLFSKSVGRTYFFAAFFAGFLAAGFAAAFFFTSLAMDQATFLRSVSGRTGRPAAASAALASAMRISP